MTAFRVPDGSVVPPDRSVIFDGQTMTSVPSNGMPGSIVTLWFDGFHIVGVVVADPLINCSEDPHTLSFSTVLALIEPGPTWIGHHRGAHDGYRLMFNEHDRAMELLRQKNALSDRDNGPRRTESRQLTSLTATHDEDLGLPCPGERRTFVQTRGIDAFGHETR